MSKAIPPDVLFAQKASAVVKAAGFDPKAIDLETFREKAPEIFLKSCCAIYKCQLENAYEDPSTKEEFAVNCQILIDLLFSKTENVALNQITGLDIVNGSHRAIGIMVGIIFGEGQRLWLEKCKRLQESERNENLKQRHLVSSDDNELKISLHDNENNTSPTSLRYEEENSPDNYNYSSDPAYDRNEDGKEKKKRRKRPSSAPSRKRQLESVLRLYTSGITKAPSPVVQNTVAAVMTKQTRPKDSYGNTEEYTYDMVSGRKITVTAALKIAEEKRRQREAAAAAADVETSGNFGRRSSYPNTFKPVNTRPVHLAPRIEKSMEVWVEKSRQIREKAKETVAKSPFEVAKWYNAYNRLEELDVVVSIEHCHDCENHQISLRHDPTKYIVTADSILCILAQAAHEASLCIRFGVIRFKARVTLRPDETESDSRIGALEVQVAHRGRDGRIVHELLHSKIATKRWPSKTVIQKRFMSYINQANIPTYPVNPDANYSSIGKEGLCPYPVGIGPWSSTAMAMAMDGGEWNFPLEPLNETAADDPHSPTRFSNDDSESVMSNITKSKPKLNNVQWIFDARSALDSDEPPIGSLVTISSLQTPSGQPERHGLIGTIKSIFQVKQAQKKSYTVKLKYQNNEFIVLSTQCTLVANSSEHSKTYPPEKCPEELESLLIFILDLHQKGYDIAPRPDQLWYVMSAEDNEKGSGKPRFFLSRSSFFHQIRQYVDVVEKELKGLQILSSNNLVQHPYTTSKIDLQRCYGEPVLDWVFDRYGTTANMHDLQTKAIELKSSALLNKIPPKSNDANVSPSSSQKSTPRFDPKLESSPRIDPRFLKKSSPRNDEASPTSERHFDFEESPENPPTDDKRSSPRAISNRSPSNETSPRNNQTDESKSSPRLDSVKSASQIDSRAVDNYKSEADEQHNSEQAILAPVAEPDNTEGDRNESPQSPQASEKDKPYHLRHIKRILNEQISLHSDITLRDNKTYLIENVNVISAVLRHIILGAANELALIDGTLDQDNTTLEESCAKYLQDILTILMDNEIADFEFDHLIKLLKAVNLHGICSMEVIRLVWLSINLMGTPEFIIEDFHSFLMRGKTVDAPGDAQTDMVDELGSCWQIINTSLHSSSRFSRGSYIWQDPFRCHLREFVLYLLKYASYQQRRAEGVSTRDPIRLSVIDVDHVIEALHNFNLISAVKAPNIEMLLEVFGNRECVDRFREFRDGSPSSPNSSIASFRCLDFLVWLHDYEKTKYTKYFMQAIFRLFDPSDCANGANQLLEMIHNSTGIPDPLTEIVLSTFFRKLNVNLNDFEVRVLFRHHSHDLVKTTLTFNQFLALIHSESSFPMESDPYEGVLAPHPPVQSINDARASDQFKNGRKLVEKTPTKSATSPREHFSTEGDNTLDKTSNMKSTPRLSNSSPRAETPQQDYDDDFSFDDDLMQEHVESKSAQYFVGEEVEVLCKGGEVYYPGKISKVRGSDCYDIGYDDGDGEENVEARLIKRKISSIKSPKTGDVISIGEAVEVNYKASGTYYTGKISRIYDDGTYDITYDDGDLQVKVDEKLIYLVKKNSEPINVGARVEANYHRKGQWFAGKITRVHSNGKYDVEYDDGDVETDVEKLNLKLR